MMEDTANRELERCTDRCASSGGSRPGTHTWGKPLKMKDESGQALVLVSLGLCVLLAFLALAIDVGMLFQAKRKLQVAADAAAMAGAMDYLYNGSKTSASTAGKSASSANGYTDGTNATVSVVEPPADGPNASSAGFVEATVSAPVSTFFMGLSMSGMGLNGTSSMTVEARAVAAAPTNGQACIWLMDATGTDLQVQGAYDIEAPGCGIYMNSTSSNAVSVTGNGGTLNAKFADAVGGSVGHQTNPTAITTYTAPRTSPWGNLTGPNPSNGTGCTYTSSVTSLTGTFTSAGTGMAGAGNTICFTKAVTLTNATFGAGTLGTTSISQDAVTTSAGTLVFGAGVTISGTVTVYGGTIDIYSGTFSQPSNTIVNVVAPTSGTYNAIAIMQPPSNTTELQVQKGSNNQVLDGYIYAPGAEVYLQDNGGGLTATGIVASWMYDKSSSITIPSYDAAHPTTTPNRVLTLVE